MRERLSLLVPFYDCFNQTFLHFVFCSIYNMLGNKEPTLYITSRMVAPKSARYQMKEVADLSPINLVQSNIGFSVDSNTKLTHQPNCERQRKILYTENEIEFTSNSLSAMFFEQRKIIFGLLECGLWVDMTILI